MSFEQLKSNKIEIRWAKLVGCYLIKLRQFICVTIRRKCFRVHSTPEKAHSFVKYLAGTNEIPLRGAIKVSIYDLLLELLHKPSPT